MTHRLQTEIRVYNTQKDAAMLQMPASRRSASTGVDLSCPVTTLRALFWQRSSWSMREGVAQGCHTGAAWVRRLSCRALQTFITCSFLYPHFFEVREGQVRPKYTATRIHNARHLAAAFVEMLWMCGPKVNSLSSVTPRNFG